MSKREELVMKAKLYGEIGEQAAAIGIGQMAVRPVLRRASIAGTTGMLISGTAMALGATSIVVKGIFMASACSVVTSFWQGVKIGLESP